MLHVTNGDAVLDGFRAGQIPGDYLAWRDPLHDGPVPATESLEALSDIRARRMSDSSWSYDDFRLEFAERDRTLAGFRDHDETVLWFEHDLYDQLQLFQLLDWLSRQDRAGVRLSLIQVGEHPDVPSFHGLGELNGKQLAALLPDRLPVTEKHLVLGREAWAAVCSDDPTSLVGLASRRDPELPFRGPALYRMLEGVPVGFDRAFANRAAVACCRRGGRAAPARVTTRSLRPSRAARGATCRCFSASTGWPPVCTPH